MMTLAGMAYSFGAYFSTALYAVLCGTGIYFVVFGASQSTAYVTAPDADEDTLFEEFLIVAASLKIMHVLFLVWEQTSMDVFLIDWERPRDGPPSVWRTLLIANEFNEIQTYRKVPYEMTLLIVLFIYEVAGAKSLAEENPSTDAHTYTDDGGQNRVLRFGTAALLFNVVGAALWLYYKVIHRTMFEAKHGAFQDLCSVSNISIIMLTHQCRGFYIHGRSVRLSHLPADVLNM